MDTTANVLSFCAGYGGIELGLRRDGVRHTVLAYVEIEAFAVANLVAKMEAGELAPCPVWTDVKTFPAEMFRGCVDILTGGYPCQPFSAAGKRGGADDPRHLWPAIRRAIDVVRPGVCFLENVEGHVTLGLRDVLQDLGRMGYRTTWGIFSAEEVGAPHRRKRVFIMAQSDSERSENSNGQSVCESGGELVRQGDGKKCSVRPASTGSGDMGHAIGTKQPRGLVSNERRQDLSGACDASGELAVASCERQHGGREPRTKRGAESANGGWPARPGQPQHEWEEPRTIEPRMGGTTDGPARRVDRLRLLGNGVVPQTAAVAWNTLEAELNA